MGTAPRVRYGSVMDEQAQSGVGAAGPDRGKLEARAAAARDRQSFARHELRAPLAVIYPLLALLLDGEAGELTLLQRGHLEVLERNVMRLEALSRSVAESGWADCSAAPPLPVAVSLGDVAEAVVAAARIAAPGGPPLEVAVADPSPCAWADLVDVRQIVSDLVANALAYAPDGPVRLHAGPGRAPGTVELEVADSGPGVPADEREHVFEFGYRGAVARERRVHGLGAGLWVCVRLARRNGGSLRLGGVPGGGLSATLALPAAPDRA